MIRFTKFLLELKELEMTNYEDFNLVFKIDGRVATDDFEITINKDNEVITIYHNSAI